MADQFDPGDITINLRRLAAGDIDAEAPLADAVYVQLQRMARGLMRNEASDMSLQPTALVNEVLLELIRARKVDWQDRAHFYRVASRLLRRRLIDHIRSSSAAKRPNKQAQVELEDFLLPSTDRFEEILSVHEGLDLLAAVDAPLAELIEMVYFGGISIPAIASIRGVSEKTIDRHLDLGRRWLASKFRLPCPQSATLSASSSEP